MDTKQDDTVMTITSSEQKEDGTWEPIEVARIHAVYNTVSDERKKNLCYNLIEWAVRELQRIDKESV